MSNLDPVEDAAASLLGPHGRQLGASPAEYWRAHPDHAFAFNAGICLATGDAIWEGDLDLTVDAPALRELAKVLDMSLYVLTESDRYALRANPAPGVTNHALAAVDPVRGSRSCAHTTTTSSTLTARRGRARTATSQGSALFLAAITRAP